ncbi:MAG: hypothetical protein ACK5AZ_26120 [Bryobacteraceae bacterium]
MSKPNSPDSESPNSDRHPTPKLSRAEAARINGAKSRSPKTPEGKQRSSLNALRHGLTAKAICLWNEDREKFQLILDAYVADLKPETDVEMDLVEEMVAAKWRIYRVWHMETGIFDIETYHLEAELEERYTDFEETLRSAFTLRKLAENPNALNYLSRHEGRLRRIYNQALQNLLQLQERRRAEQAAQTAEPTQPAPPQPEAPATPEPDLADPPKNDKTNRTPPAPAAPQLGPAPVRTPEVTPKSGPQAPHPRPADWPKAS